MKEFVIILMPLGVLTWGPKQLLLQLSELPSIRLIVVSFFPNCCFHNNQVISISPLVLNLSTIFSLLIAPYIKLLAVSSIVPMHS